MSITLSKREQALTALFKLLKTELSDINVLRNEVLNISIAKTGLVILRDGSPGDPEVILSPVRYLYQHEVSLEIFVQNANSAVRDSQMDALLVRIGEILEANKTLNNRVDYMYSQAPELLTEPIEGAASMKAAKVLVFLEYWTNNPLS